MSILSKSKYINGLKCLKYLWIYSNDYDKIPKPSTGLQHRFDEGYLVGELAKKLYPNGIDIPPEPFSENIKNSKELIKLRKPLFEAAFSADNMYSRTDILNPIGNDEWDIIEVKSSTSVKPEQIPDITFKDTALKRQD